MATLWHEVVVAIPADHAWQALRRVDEADRLFAPVLSACTMAGDVRTVTFNHGLVVQERIVAVDETRRRVAYTVLGPSFDHHAASMQIVPVDAASCRFIWISDVLPHDRADAIRPLVEAGALALAATLREGATLGRA